MRPGVRLEKFVSIISSESADGILQTLVDGVVQATGELIRF